MVKVADLIHGNGKEPARITQDLELLLGIIRPDLLEQCEKREAEHVRQLLGDLTVEGLIDSAKGRDVTQGSEEVAMMLELAIGRVRQEEIRALHAAGATSGNNPEALARLRRLQKEAADEQSREFEKALPLPPGSGYALLARIRRLLRTTADKK